MLEKIEKMTNNKIPAEIKNLIRNTKFLTIPIDGYYEEITIPSDVEIIEMFEEQKNLFGYDIVPFAILDDDFICIHFKGERVTVIYWSSELALESTQMAIFELFPSIENFMNEIKNVRKKI